MRSRSLHGCVAAAAAGLALAPAPRTAVVVVAVASAMLLSACRAPTLGALAAALVLAGAAAGAWRLEAIDAPAAAVASQAGGESRLRVHLLSRPRASPFGESAEVRVAAGRLAGARLLMRVPLWTPFPDAAEPGAELAVAGRVRALEDERDESRHADREGDGAGGEFDFAAYLRRSGVSGELFADRVRATGRRRAGLAGLLDRLRTGAERGVAAGMDGPEASLARGMVLGQDEEIAEGVREDFRASGLAHLLAVSGQNVMLLVALALPLLVLTGAGPSTRGIVLLGLIALYVPLAGAGPSLQRAAVMGAAGIAALTLSRPSSRWYALLLAAAVTLALNPRSSADPGWQLSFAAVVGILVLGVPLGRGLARAVDSLLPGATAPPPRASAAEGGSSSGSSWVGAVRAVPLRSPVRGVLRAAAEGIGLTIAATLATAPLLAHHFGAVSLAALPANVMALPAVAPAMWLGMLKATLGLAAPLVPGAQAAAGALGPVAAAPVCYVAWLSERFADLRHAQVDLPLRSTASVAAAYALIAGCSLAAAGLAGRTRGRVQELAGQWRRRPAGLRAAVLAVAVAGLTLGVVLALAPARPPDALTVRFLDVGQGDATLIQHPEGGAVLFDGGPPEGGIERLLRRAGVRELAVVVATHASRDHQGGLPEVLRRHPVGLLLDGGDESADPGFRALLGEASRRRVRTIRAVAPMTLRAGALTIRILSPPPRTPGPPPDDPNPRGVVAVVSAGDFDLFLSADAESEALIPLELPDVDAMKVPHHGSADPGLPELLERLRPELAAIEVGQNTYGHPTPSTLAALRSAGVATRRTDRDGTVTVTVGERSWEVTTARGGP